MTPLLTDGSYCGLALIRPCTPRFTQNPQFDIDGLVQDCSISIHNTGDAAVLHLAIDMALSCTAYNNKQCMAIWDNFTNQFAYLALSWAHCSAMSCLWWSVLEYIFRAMTRFSWKSNVASIHLIFDCIWKIRGIRLHFSYTQQHMNIYAVIPMIYIVIVWIHMLPKYKKNPR